MLVANFFSFSSISFENWFFILQQNSIPSQENLTSFYNQHLHHKPATQLQGDFTSISQVHQENSLQRTLSIIKASDVISDDLELTAAIMTQQISP